MTTRPFTIATVVLGAALSACAASAPPARFATAQSPGLQLQRGTIDAALGCGGEDGGFNVPDAMKLPKSAFNSCSPQ